MNTLYQEIREQPVAVERCLSANASSVAQIAAQMHNRKVRNLVLLARGTSRNAGLYATYLFGWQNQTPVLLIQPSLATFLDSMPMPSDASLVVVSQSGSSPDLGYIMRTARAMGVYCLAITNTPHSPLAKGADHILDIAAGPERAVAATKTYVNQLVTLAMLSQAWNSERSVDKPLASLPEAIKGIFELEELIKEVAQELHQYPTLLVIGRGFHHATACETALKLQELTYIHAMPFTSADLIHGPIALLDEQAVVICLDSGCQPNPHYTEITSRAIQAGSKLVVLTHHPQRWNDATHLIPLPSASQVEDCYSPIPTIVAVQLLAMYMGQAKGLDVVNPRFLSKETLTS